MYIKRDEMEENTGKSNQIKIGLNNLTSSYRISCNIISYNIKIKGSYDEVCNKKKQLFHM